MTVGLQLGSAKDLWGRQAGFGPQIESVSKSSDWKSVSVGHRSTSRPP